MFGYFGCRNNRQSVTMQAKMGRKRITQLAASCYSFDYEIFSRAIDCILFGLTQKVTSILRLFNYYYTYLLDIIKKSTTNIVVF